MKILQKKSLIIEIIASLLILLFVYAAASKLINIPQSTFDMGRQPLPEWSKPILVWAVPISELVISALLLIPRTRYIGLWGSLILMTAFSLYIALALGRAFGEIPCSCGGILSEQFNWKNHLIFNFFFVIISIIGILLSKDRLRSAKPPLKQPSVG